MSTPRTATNRSETFGRLLSGAINSIATYEGKTAPIVEDELGQQIGIAGKTIQRYKAGYLPPEARTVSSDTCSLHLMTVRTVHREVV